MIRWGRRIVLVVLLIWGLLFAVRCHLPRQATVPTADSTSTIYLVRHGWHAGIALRRSDVPERAWPTLHSIPNTRFVEIGWGEAHYYPGLSRGVWGLLRAGAWPTNSVVHVVPVDEAIRHRFDQHTIVRIDVGRAELAGLATYIARSFSVSPPDSASPVEPGYYANSQFYTSPLSYHLFNNCNHWAAGALEAAGCDTSPRWTFRVKGVIRQARTCGTLVQQRPDQ